MQTSLRSKKRGCYLFCLFHFREEIEKSLLKVEFYMLYWGNFLWALQFLKLGLIYTDHLYNILVGMAEYMSFLRS